jgi:hypothetical protein
METINVLQPVWNLTYGGKNITAAVSPYVVSVTYTDHVHGESDELEIVFEDAGGGWKNAWYPEKGDRVSLEFGYAGETLVPAGDFEVEEIEAAGDETAGDTLTVRALASGVSTPLRTKHSNAYEGTTLAGIAGQVAAKHSLTVVGTIEDVPIKRITQNQEKDLAFLKRVAASYGYVFTVKGSQLVFSKRSDLAMAMPGISIDRIDMIRYSIKDKGVGTAKAAHVAYNDPKTGELIQDQEDPEVGDDD